MSRHGRPGPPSWATALLGDDSAPPQLYAWTAANLGGSSSSSAPAGRTDEEAEEAHRRRIYVLGVGNLGRLFASGLAKAEPRPPITLVVHRRALLEQWLARPGIEMTRGGRVETARDFEVEWWTAEKPGSGPVAAPGGGDAAIANLVVTTKAADALPQVDRLRRYLDGRSTVAFAQNGMCRLWPPLGAAYTAHRYPGGGGGGGGGPNWVACVTMHGVTSLGPFRSVHASPASLVVGPVLLNPNTAAAADYLMTQLAQAPDLAGRRVARTDLWILQLEKLVVNAVINPLTAVLRCKNGDVFAPAPDGADDEGDGLAGVVDTLIQEASSVLRALVLDPGSDAIRGEAEGRGGSGGEALARRFGFDRLRAMVLDVGDKVKDNTSSMLQDVRAGKTTEIDAFNGWLVETAEALGTVGGGELAVPTHRRLMALVKEGAALSRRDLRAALADPSRT